MNKRSILFVFAFLYCNFLPSCFAGNILNDIFRAYTKYQEINMMLWLAGDVKAEKRFGEETKWFINLTSKKEKNPEINRWVHSVFDRVKANFRERGFNYNITVLQGNDVNAFAIPGGSIFIYKGMLNFVSSDDELAAVLAHELAHSERRHSLQMLRTSAAFQLLLQKAVKSGRDRETWGQVVGALTSLRFSREHEVEADALGQQRMFESGYNPGGQVLLWEKFVQKFGKGDTGIGKYLSTHPPSQERVDSARKGLAKYSVPEQKDFSLSLNILAEVRENLLQNPSFESDISKTKIPDSWFVQSGDVSKDNSTSATGKSSIRLSSDNKMRVVRVNSDFIQINPSEKYELSGSMKSSDGTQQGNIGAEIYDKKKKLKGYVWPITFQQPISKTWMPVFGLLHAGGSKSVNFPPETAYIKILLQNGPLSKGEIWFDELRLKRAATKDRVNLVKDGDFEYEGQNGLPRGVSGNPLVVQRSLDKFKTGYASLSLLPSNNKETKETSFEFFPLSMANLVGKTDFQISWHFSGTDSIKSKLRMFFIDENGKPVIEKPFLESEFTTKINLWESTGLRFSIKLAPDVQQKVKAISISVISLIPPEKQIWLDGFVLE
ncbi:MAG: M48 family metallopeptidase [Candidatus Riflebacteria bacterium]|nr:M48 family metallopeptidase [Candidatus Riflebacteria bacterium]